MANANQVVLTKEQAAAEMQRAKPQTPYDDAVARCLVPVGCGYKSCAEVIFGYTPIAQMHGLPAVRDYERRIAEHGKRMGHRQRRLRELPA